MLIPDGAAGAILGKGGRTIMDIQSDTGATIDVEKRRREEVSVKIYLHITLHET